MNSNRIPNPKSANSAKPKKSSAKSEGKRVYLIAAAILAVFVVHFAWQFSFVQKENLRIAEDSMRDAQLNAPIADAPPVEKTVAVVNDFVPQKMPVAESVKSVSIAKYSPPAIKIPSPAAKNKTVRDEHSERLRRAEKLLTGF